MKLTVMTGGNGKLSRRMEKGLISLMKSRTLTEAAKLSGIGESTLRRYLQSEAFQAQYRQARRMTTANALARLQSTAEEAANVLIERLKDNPLNLNLTASRIQLSAARTVLELATRGIQDEDMEARIQSLETALERIGAT